MKIIKMITDQHDEPQTVNMAFGPEIPLTFTVNEEGLITMSTNVKKPLEFYTDFKNYENDPRYELDAEVRNLMYQRGLTDYTEAMELVLAADPELKKRYAES